MSVSLRRFTGEKEERKEEPNEYLKFYVVRSTVPSLMKPQMGIFPFFYRGFRYPLLKGLDLYLVFYICLKLMCTMRSQEISLPGSPTVLEKGDQRFSPLVLGKKARPPLTVPV